MAHANVSKAGEMKHRSVFAQHRGTQMKGKSILTYKDATNHATSEKLRAMLEKWLVGSSVGGYSAVTFRFPYTINAARQLHGRGYAVF